MRRLTLCALTAAFVLIAAGVLFPATVRPALLLAVIAGLACWVIGQDFGKVLTGKHAQATAFIGETSEGISASASASPRDLETMFQLIYLRMTAPRKDPDQFAIWQTTSAQQATDQMRSPEFQYFRNAAAALYKNNIRRSLPAPEDYGKVDLDKALAFYKERFADASGFTFVIVGGLTAWRKAGELSSAERSKCPSHSFSLASARSS